MADDQIKQLLEQAQQAYTKNPNPSTLVPYLQDMMKIGMFDSGMEAGQKLSQLSTELSKFVAEKSADLVDAAQKQELGLINTIMSMDKDAVDKMVSGGFGVIGFFNNVLTIAQVVGSFLGVPKETFENIRETLYDIGKDLREDLQDAKSAVSLQPEAHQILDRFEENFERIIDEAEQAGGTFNRLNNSLINTVGQTGTSSNIGSYAGNVSATAGSPNAITLDEFKDVVENSGLTPALQQGLMNTALTAASMGGDTMTIDASELDMLRGHASFDTLSTAQKGNINPKLELALNN